MLLTGFNTSHVTINLRVWAAPKGGGSSFNTSHVTINQWFVFFFLKRKLSFNTSHVTINPGLGSAQGGGQ